jgi:hypothetical protein
VGRGARWQSTGDFDLVRRGPCVRTIFAQVTRLKRHMCARVCGCVVGPMSRVLGGQPLGRVGDAENACATNEQGKVVITDNYL